MLRGPISRINSQVVVKRLRRISDSPTDPNAEGSDELDGEEVGVVHNSIGHKYSTSPSQPTSRRFQIQLIPSTLRKFQQVLSTIPFSIPPPLPYTSTSRPALVSPVRTSPIPQPRNSPMVTSQQLNPVASSSRRREDQLSLPVPPPKYFREGFVDLSGLPEKIQIWKKMAKMLWPGCLEELKEIVGRSYLC
ncbi:hypothetical protein O181_012687 [Austropuccinia psidii MF-1]|uniref:Uncharacterized protein n=1 Tax=Austropuccinia psidii MF-1 TaxID=1389203 RepID=A0A9Q3BWW2_9BASI|nr:hypothetical protein [Austropuccinia psidii MF-1]